MGYDWRQVPALLAGAGVLVATTYLMALSPPTHRGAAPPQPAAGLVLARPGIPNDMPASTRPSEALSRAVERVARGALPEPYFLDQALAAKFLERWQGRLIEGRVRVAMADQFDAGAENGHRVPVSLWIDSDSRVMGLTGEATFEPTPGGLKLRQLHLEPVPLAVPTWAEAAARVRRADPIGGEPTRTDAPFYGLFRFSQQDGRYAVSAQTGEVLPE